jgi:polysaccharide biosynthesis/export protein
MQFVILALFSLFVQDSAAAKANTEYVVGVKDVLEIVVHGHEPLSLQRAVVDPDGSIEHPELGRVPVAGKTAREIEEDLKKRFLSRQILTKVSLVVTVKEFRSQTVTLIGEGITKPGSYPVRGDQSLLEVIGEAGGFTAQAGGTVMIARRTADGKNVGPAQIENMKGDDVVRIAKADLEMGRAPKVALRDGDTIYVAKAEVFFIDGQVRSPGEYVLRRDLTMGRAVVIAGGYTDRARKGAFEIERIVNGKVDKTKAKESDVVKPGDRITVKSRWW